MEQTASIDDGGSALRPPKTTFDVPVASEVVDDASRRSVCRFPRTPSIHQGSLYVGEGIARDVVSSVVRQEFNSFKECYARGLEKNPNLSGRLAVRFVIDRQGRVTSLRDDGSAVPDRAVIACVLHEFAALTFPAPRGTETSVSYSIVLSPPD
jgi:hypothetical protein